MIRALLLVVIFMLGMVGVEYVKGIAYHHFHIHHDGEPIPDAQVVPEHNAPDHSVPKE